MSSLKKCSSNLIWMENKKWACRCGKEFDTPQEGFEHWKLAKRSSNDQSQ